MKKITFLSVLVLMLSACSWVDLSDDGKNVAVLGVDEVSNCDRLGSTSTSVADRVVFQRSTAKVALELETLARNWAAEQGGDTIVPTSPVRNGERSYDMYKCRL